MRSTLKVTVGSSPWRSCISAARIPSGVGVWTPARLAVPLLGSCGACSE